MSDQILAPNIYLCAYQLHKDYQQTTDHPLWQKCDRLMQQFTQSTDQNLTSHPDFQKTDSDSYADQRERPILLTNQNSITFNLKDQPEISGFAQPIKLQDSYGLWFNIGYDDQHPNTKNESIEILSKFNPENSLIFPPSETFPLLGQTIILTLWLTDHRSDRPSLTQLANDCYSKLFPDQPRSLIRSGKLFDSLIFEYGNPRRPDDTHILIWLFQSAETEKTLNKCFSQIFDLLFYYHKVIHAYQDSRLIYDQLKEYYHGLDQVLDAIQDKIDDHIPLNSADDQYLPYLKEKLKALSTDNLAYERLVRKMRDFLTTIEINFHNYQEKITKIASDLAINQTELSFLQYFGENIAPSFQKQIEDDLKYFDQGTALISQAIATIRSIVAIDQLQCDQKSQITLERNRKQIAKSNEKLQDLIQSIGVGIAAGAIVASCSGLVPTSSKYFFLAILLSALVALIFACGTKFWLNYTRDSKYCLKLQRLYKRLYKKFYKRFLL